VAGSPPEGQPLGPLLSGPIVRLSHALAVLSASSRPGLRVPSFPPLRLPARWSSPASLLRRLSPPGPRQRVLALPLTTVAVALLIGVPGVILSRWSRPRADGVEQLMGAASLLQSFPATPDRPVPALWTERLGPQAARTLWQSQRRVWWQFWATHAESAPFLAFPVDPARSLGSTLPPNALRVGDLLVFAENPTARQQLLSSLRPLQRRSQGLSLRCRDRLQATQAVFWQADALGTLLGPIAPLLERYQVGCLTLALEERAIRWQGEAAAESSGLSSLNRSPGGVAGVPGAGALPPLGAGRDGSEVPSWPQQPPLPDDLLLELEGSSLDQLFQGLLARQIIRDPLASRYGLEGSRLALVRQAPFRLRLHPLPEGPYQASLDLLVRVNGARGAWSSLLERASTSLLAQGFVAAEAGTALNQERAASGSQSDQPSQAQAAPQGAAPAPAAPPGPAPVAATQGDGAVKGSSSTVWKRADGTVVGGWRWLVGSDGQPQLLLFLGPPPPSALPMPVVPPRGGQGSQLALRVRPAALEALGLIPEEMPPLVRRASQVWIDSGANDPGRPQGEISSLTGRLQLQR